MRCGRARMLRPAPSAVPCLPMLSAEREWIADHLDARYQRARDDGVSPPTAAVLVRRNADAAPIADALRARGVPVEVVGLAGLLAIPEVAEVVAMLRLVADPDGRRCGDAGAHRFTLAARCPRPRGAVAARACRSAG